MGFKKLNLFREKPKEQVKTSVEAYLGAQVSKSEIKRKVDAGQDVSWKKGDKTDDVSEYIQSIMETTDGAKIAGNRTDKAVREHAWLAAYWQDAIDNGDTELAEAFEFDFKEQYAELRLGGGIRKDQLGPEIVIPPPELRPSNYPTFRPTSRLPGIPKEESAE